MGARHTTRSNMINSTYNTREPEELVRFVRVSQKSDRMLLCGDVIMICTRKYIATVYVYIDIYMTRNTERQHIIIIIIICSSVELAYTASRAQVSVSKAYIGREREVDNKIEGPQRRRRSARRAIKY